MKIRNLALAALLMASSVAATAAQAAERVAAAPQGDAYQATVTKIVKLVEWQRYRTTRWQRATLQNLLLVGDTIRTGPDAKTELLYGDGSVTRVGSLTSLTLTGDNKRELRLESGKVWLHIQKGGAGMKVITPGAVAAVTGTELLVEFDPVKKLTEVTVFEGSVNVSSDVGNLVRVLGGTTTMVPMNAPAAAPVPLPTQKLEVRENIFKPLALPGASEQQPDTTAPDGAAPSAKPPETAGTDNPTGVATPKPEAGATTPDGQVTQPAANATPPAMGPVANEKADPDLKGQTEQLLDPRTLNGSPTTGTIRVIIE